MPVPRGRTDGEHGLNSTTRFAAAAACSVILLVAGSAWPQAYPSKPVRLIVPFAPGGGADLVGRLLAQKLTAALGRQVVVENRAGAGGRIGTEAVAKAPPDGHTLLLATSSVMALAPALYDKLSFDMPRDFAPVSVVATTAYVLVVHPAVPARSAKELIGLAKRTPRSLTYASSGTGAQSHLTGELFCVRAGVTMIHVPYKGSSSGTLSVVAGETDSMFSNLVPALPSVRSNRLRPLGVTSRARSSILPEVPVLASTIPGLVVEQLYGLLAPAGTPREIVMVLNAEAAKAMQAADVRDKLLADGSEVAVSTPEELEKRIVAEIAQWAKVIKAAGVKPE
jgi:tripartite-type tricarboxylate transporter receptor subunit TctC